jgi:hypothetical protein
MTGLDFPRPYIIGYGSSPSRCGPPTQTPDGQTRDSGEVCKYPDQLRRLLVMK